MLDDRRIRIRTSDQRIQSWIQEAQKQRSYGSGSTIPVNIQYRRTGTVFHVCRVGGAEIELSS